MSNRIRHPAPKLVCTKCKRRPRRKGQRWCDACHADYQTRLRAKQRAELEALRADRQILHNLRGLGSEQLSSLIEPQGFDE